MPTMYTEHNSIIMGGDVRSNTPHSSRHTGRTNVKSGCRTCKIRKVKCDEGRPACRRCVSTGRVCDGYGVWGGGGNYYGHRQQSILLRDSSVAPWPSACVSILADCTEESRYFEWFKCRTAKKIPGAFVLSFWDKLLFQASWSEPAVLHAVLTLSSVHKREIFSGDDAPDEQHQFMLQHYTKAIRHLQPHFSTKDRASVRVALITCMVFICLEFLRGNFSTAQTHLQSGLKVLRELQLPSNVNEGILLFERSYDSIDDWIVAAFSRLHVQAELFKQTYLHPCLVLQASGSEPIIPIFHSINEAWQQMELLLNRIFHLTEQARQQQASNSLSMGYSSALLGQQEHIQAQLARWLETYEASKTDMKSQESGELRCRLLRAYHIMASMMTATCLRQDDESMYDSYTEQFVFLINLSIDMWKNGTSRSRVLVLPGHYIHMSRSIVDIGWIPPLYYAALKCRVHRIRLHAIRLLESASHREGIWDSKIAACVVRKVMEIEEGDYYKGIDTADDFPLSSSPKLRDLSLPTLPQSHRILEVMVLLSNGPMDNVFLSYRQEQTRRDWTDVRVSIQCHG